ncbi:hypothetical protein AGMMS50225_01000 [Betaproteobacteria bacterium]|nr:hypothetical protein AGMMS50225_01000 [Betaproteobacteria bacterium]
MNQSTSLAIGEITIRQLDGLYSLNDLHRASGGEVRHQPALFIRHDQTKALITEIYESVDSNAGIHAFKTQRGANGGTYACRELVIAYAAWIAPAFHLKVIRVFLDANATKLDKSAEAPTFKNRRWLVGFDFDGKESVSPVPHDAFVLTVPELIRELRTNDYLTFSRRDLPEIIRACCDRMAAEIPGMVHPSVVKGPDVDDGMGMII